MPGSSRASAPVRLEVLLNGRRVAIAGVEKFGVISAIITWVRRNPANITEKMRSDEGFDELHFLRETCDLDLGGLDSVSDKHLFWAKEALRPGSEITIRVLPAGEFDPPRGNDDA
jgi:hypothetical protein